MLFGIENAVTLWLGALLVLDVAQGSGFSVGMLYAFVSYKSQFMQRTAALVENLLQLRMLGLPDRSVCRRELRTGRSWGQGLPKLFAK